MTSAPVVSPSILLRSLNEEAFLRKASIHIMAHLAATASDDLTERQAEVMAKRAVLLARALWAEFRR